MKRRISLFLLNAVFLSRTAHGQSEKSEEKPTEKVSTAEVSSPACHLTNTPKLAYNDRLRESQSLRQRRRPEKVQQVDDQTPLLLSTNDLVTNTKTSANDKIQKLKYPRISTAYPRIPPNNQNSIQELKDSSNSKSKNIVNPPFSRVPVFLKCNVNKKNHSDDEEPDDVEEKKELTTDLDIQFRQLKLESLTSSRASVKSSDERCKNISNKNSSQSLVQYCNFEEKKIVKVAPHIRRKDVICDTVDAWSRQSSTDSMSPAEKPRYRPLIFGGTYPIDAPFNSATNEPKVKMIAGRRVAKTFNIDAPTSLE